MICIE